MWKIIKKLSLALLALLFFASCANEEYGTEENMGKASEKIHFEIVVGKTTATPSGVETRVTTGSTYESTFDDGDEIGVYIVKGSGGLQASGNWVDNMKMTYNNGNWIPTFPAGKGYYPTDGDELNFYAYYPYNEAVTNALNMSISGLTDQSSAANLSKSDLLSACTLNVEKGNGNTPVQLNFLHALTMVELSVSGGTGAQMSSEVAVTLEGCNPDALFNLFTGVADAAGSVKSVKMYRVEQSGDVNYLREYTYRAMVPTQTVFTGAELFRFSGTQGTITRALSYSLASDVALYSGQVKPYTITLQPQTSGITYNVGDYYPKNGFPILGVVFETSNGGKNGKIVSLDEAINVSWGNPAVDEQVAGVGNIRETNDGQAGTKNLIVKRKDQSDFATTYGAFNWIYQTKNNGDVNGMWYMPANNELTAFRNVWNADRSGFSSKLTGLGSNTIWEDCYYWSLSEFTRDFTFFILMNNGLIYNSYYSKSYADWSFRVRAISKF